MKIRQCWYRRHQLFNQSLLSWLFDASPLASRLVALCDDNSSVPGLSQDRQKPEPEAAIAFKNIHSALVKQVLLYCEGGSIDGRFA
jgi:hypothetical protein